MSRDWLCSTESIRQRTISIDDGKMINRSIPEKRNSPDSRPDRSQVTTQHSYFVVTAVDNPANTLPQLKVTNIQM